MSHTIRSTFLGCVAALLLGALATALLPTTVGGGFMYVSVHGSSMSPRIHNGDLVLLRRAPPYHLDDVVAYRAPKLGVVLHRITGFDGARYTLRGDNRSSADEYHPTADEILAREWVVIQGGGRLLDSVQTLRFAVLVSIGAGALGVASLALRRRRAGGNVRQGSSPGFSAFGERGGALLAAGAVVLVGSLGALFMLDRLGPTAVVNDTLAYAASSRFTYGDAAGNGIYDSDTVVEPQPLFLAVKDRLPIAFTYSLSSTSPGAEWAQGGGSLQLQGRVVHQNGWTRAIDLGPPRPFEGTRGSVAAMIDIAGAWRLIDAMEAGTGMKSDTYAVEVSALGTVHATLGGAPVSQQIERTLHFRLTRKDLVLVEQDRAVSLSTTGTVARERTVPRVFELPGGVRLSVSPVRASLTVAAATSTLVLIGVLLDTLLVWRAGPAAVIRAKYGGRIMDADSAGFDFDGLMIVLQSADELMHMSERISRDAIWVAARSACYLILIDGATAYLVTIPQRRRGQGPSPRTRAASHAADNIVEFRSAPPEGRDLGRAA